MIEKSINLIPEDKLDVMTRRTFDLLEKTGVEAQHPKILKMTAEKGARVDFDVARIRFPRELVKECLEIFLGSFCFGDRNGIIIILQTCHLSELPSQSPHVIKPPKTCERHADAQPTRSTGARY